MARYLRQNSNTTLKMGPFIASADFITVQNTLTISASNVKLSKNGGTLTQKSEPTNITNADADGYYAIALSGVDVDTVGRLRAEITLSGSLPVWDDFVIISQPVYDSLFGSTALSTVGSEMSLSTATRVMLSAGQPDYAPALQSTLIAGINNISGSEAIIITKVDNLSGGQSTIITKVDNISATQALQTTLVAGINNISGSQTNITTKVDNISATQASQALQTTLVNGISNLSGSNNTIITKVDGVSATQTLQALQSTLLNGISNISATQVSQATEANATTNKNSILSSVSTISGNVNTILTSAHGGGAWDAVAVVGEVVLSASQPHWNLAEVGDVMALSASQYNAIAKEATLLSVSSDVDLIPTNPLITTDSRLNNLNATISSRASQTSIASISGDVWNNANRTLTQPVTVSGNVTLDSNTRVVLSAGQPDYAPALQTLLLAVSNNVASILGDTSALPSDPASNTLMQAYTNAILTKIATISADVWTNTVRTLTQAVSVSGNVTLDPSTRVVLSASQPDYNIAKETSATANKDSIISNVLTRLATSGYTAPDNTTIANIAISASAIKERTDNLSDNPADELNATANKNDVLTKFISISGDVNTILTSAHGAGQWDAVSNTPVVLSASQPYYAPAIAGDPMTLIPALSASILKHEDLIDGNNIDYILEATMAMVNGNFSISGDSMTLYKRDGLTPFSVINKTTTTRQRVS